MRLEMKQKTPIQPNPFVQLPCLLRRLEGISGFAREF